MAQACHTRQMSDLKQFLSLNEAAIVLGISTRTAYNWATSGELPVVVINGVRRVPRTALQSWLDERDRQALEAVRAP
jgi:excisionase family DNA binding protein